MRLTFLGAAGTVTGSKFLVEEDGYRVLIDCGLFQGPKAVRRLNWERFPLDPAEIDAVVLTHAHIDHTGYLPRLVQLGFDGDVLGTPPTCDLAEILIEDSAEIQEEDARYHNARGTSRHRPAEPLYTVRDAKRAQRMLRARDVAEPFDVGPFRARYTPAGHILGACSVRLEAGGRSIQFSGDVGRPTAPLMAEPEPCGDADWIVMESTYGDRLHPDHDPVEVLTDVVRRTVERDGVLLIPAFAVGRSQAFVYYLDKIFDREPSLRVPVYVDSPMATDVTKLYLRYPSYHRLSQAECADVCRSATFIRRADESKELNRKRGPFVVISSSGMLTGGRILHHLRVHGGDERNTILMGGYQAPGTRGRALLDGAERVKIHGKERTIRAEIAQVSGLSAHGDQEHLLEWLGGTERAPEHVFLVHGEPDAANVLAHEIRDAFDYRVRVPRRLDSVSLD